MIRTNHARTASIFIVLITTLLSCSKKDVTLSPADTTLSALDADASGGITVTQNAAVPVSWYKLELKLIKESAGFTPPVAARAIAYTGIALHEAVVNGNRYGHSLGGQLDAFSRLPAPERYKKYDWAIAANSALAAIIRQLIPNASPTNAALITQLEAANLDTLRPGVSQEVVNRSVAYGQSIAAAVYQWSATDGGKDGYLNNFPDTYVPPVGPGLWIPTPPGFQRAMLPYWGNNRLLVRNCSPLTYLPHPPYSADSTSAFGRSAWSLYRKSKTLTPAETNIALYWADGTGTFTPPGHLIGIAVQLADEQQLNLQETAALLAQVGIGLNDAGIVCWKYKYRYNLLRPVTYIRNLIEPGWNSLIGTPPFPSYTSGHATFSSAAGHILAARFGQQFTFTDQQKVPDGFTARTFTRFTDMIDEAAVSRIYGGIHYDFDSENGKISGQDVARNVLSLQL
ncbi:vanadium-dependent haloperoxidase [Chitinophaga solisilvae]|uniref:vanadium-dependent haloperoxidase n=1 Tax=Chitinophaga solisilvae TaxID=1233460 RepID=UPI0013689EA3|nr:vanadium-dependent haloperoxidase [Chitinophaga solisilvae]